MFRVHTIQLLKLPIQTCGFDEDIVHDAHSVISGQNTSNLLPDTVAIAGGIATSRLALPFISRGLAAGPIKIGVLAPNAGDRADGGVRDPDGDGPSRN